MLFIQQSALYTVSGRAQKPVSSFGRAALLPAESKGPVERRVVRVVTPGTLSDEALLEDRGAP